MKRQLALMMVGVLAVAVVVIFAVGLLTPTTSPPSSSVRSSMEIVRLTETLVVNSGDIIRDKHFVWAGPPTSPMLQMVGTQFASLEHLEFEVPIGNHASAAVELSNTPAGGPLGNSLSDLRMGSSGVSGNFDFGLLWTGFLNGDSNTITNISVFGASRVGISLSNPQATGNTFRGIYVFHTPIGLHSEAGGSIECQNCGFIGSTDVDIELTKGAGLILIGTYSEQSRAFARVAAGPGAGGLTVLGGYWQWSGAANGATITGENECCFRSWLRLTDFTVTPLDAGSARGTIAGFPPANRFFSNIAGIADPT